jgi:hypothetical protein
MLAPAVKGEEREQLTRFLRRASEQIRPVQGDGEFSEQLNSDLWRHGGSHGQGRCICLVNRLLLKAIQESCRANRDAREEDGYWEIEG